MHDVTLRIILGIIIWGGIVALQVILMAIARFFERTSRQQTWYKLYLIPVLFTCVGAGHYLNRIFVSTRHPDFAGDPATDILFLATGLLLIVLGNLLHEKMIGETHSERY